MNKPRSMINLNIPVNGNYTDEHNNQIIAPVGLKNVNVIFKGRNNKLFLKDNSLISNCKIEFASDNGFFSIGSASNNFNAYIRIGYSCQVTIGNGCTTTNSLYMTCAESTRIHIGNDCMFATNNQIRTDDAHAIYDSTTGERSNLSKDIFIGNHVWIAYNAVIMGGSDIGDGSIVGFGSFVNKKFPNNCLLAGTPAKKLKENVAWKRPNLIPFTPEQSLQAIPLPSPHFEKTEEVPTHSGRYDHILDIRKFHADGNTFYIEGVLIIKGIQCKEWSDVDYYIHFENEEFNTQLLIAKSNHPELSKIYGDGTINYSKCYFATKNFAGINISNLKKSKYNLFLTIKANRALKKIPLNIYIDFDAQKNQWNFLEINS